MRPLQRGSFQRLVPTALAGLCVALLVSCTGTTRSQVEVQTSTTAPDAPSTTLVADCAETLPPSAQAGQLLMVMVTAPGLAKEALDTGIVGGFGLKGRQSKQVGDEIKNAVSGAPVKAFVASDEEGGSVQRLAYALGSLKSAASMAKGTPDEAATAIGEYARKMVGIGVDMSFAPVADVGSGSDLGTRSFGDDPEKVSSFVTASVKAQQDAGLIAVVKHWPGIGGGDTDTHKASETVASIAELSQKDLIPFNAAIKAQVKGVMVAHVEVPGLTEEGTPASLSTAAITEQLKGRDGFKGLVITDSLGMGAILQSFTQDEAAEKAIAAGADIALLSGADAAPVAHQRLTEAITSRRISQARVIDAVRKVLTAKGVTGECPDLVASMANAQKDLAKPNADDGTGSGSTATNGTGSGTSGTGATNSGSGTGGTSTGTGTTGNGTGTGTGAGQANSGSGQKDTGINDTP